MINFSPGDIILIPFPFTDLTTFKKRPCIVLSTKALTGERPDVIVAAISSHIPEKIGSYEYLLTDDEQQACGLPKISLIRISKIVTLDTRLVRNKLGKLPLASLARVMEQVRELFFLENLE